MLSAALLLAGCGGGGTEVTVTRAASTSADNSLIVALLPLSFPEPVIPADNALNADKVELGRFLFYDKRLSGNGTQACAGCHQQKLAFTDGLETAVGSTGEAHPRNSQSLGNVAYNATLTWANPALVSLEVQMKVPLEGVRPVEMGLNDANKAAVMARFSSNSSYVARFKAAFPGEANPITLDNVRRAISAFQRTLISGGSKYDQYLEGKATLTPSEERGKTLFFGEKAECFHCHGSFNFNDQVTHVSSRLGQANPFHNTGLYNIGGTGAFPEPNRGVYESSFVPSDMGKFRAPSLRNVEVTAPYMHDGSIKTLAEVLDFYAAGGRHITTGPHAGDGRLNPFKDGLINNIQLDVQEREDIVAFLKTLTDHDFLTNPRISDPFQASNAAP